MKGKTGTREWSAHSANCIIGCEHNCRYCFAKANALRFGCIKTADEWGVERVNEKAFEKSVVTHRGVVMFPTSHDITAAHLGKCLEYLAALILGGNRVLVVTKPHYMCVAKMCDVFAADKAQIEFRFTIGSTNDETLSYWEPGAPNFEERYSCLKLAYGKGFKTSVSMEPLLCDPVRAENLFYTLSPYASEIWIGAMNDIVRRVKVETEEDRKRVAELESWQTLDAKKHLYCRLMALPPSEIMPLRWKDSYQKALGLGGPRG